MMKMDPVIGFQVPMSLPGVDAHLMVPKLIWKDHDEYDKAERKLADMYIQNFEKHYAGKGSVNYTQYGPKTE